MGANNQSTKQNKATQQRKRQSQNLKVDVDFSEWFLEVLRCHLLLHQMP